MAHLRLATGEGPSGAVATADMTLAALGNEFLDDLEFARQASPYTLRDYRDDLRLFIGFVEGTVHPGRPATLADFNKLTIRAFVAEMGRRGRAPKSVRHYLTTLRTLGRFFVAQEVIDANPALAVDGPKAPQDKPVPIAEEALEAFFRAIPNVREGPRHRALFTLLLATGLRIGEAVALKIEDLDLGRSMLWVRRGKGKKDRPIPLAPDVIALLTKYIRTSRHAPATADDARYLWISRSGHRLTKSTVQENLRTICARANLDPHRLHLHAWRATFATRHASSGTSITVLQGLMGHANVNTTAHYVGTSHQEMAAAILRVPLPPGAVV